MSRLSRCVEIEERRKAIRLSPEYVVYEWFQPFVSLLACSDKRSMALDAIWPLARECDLMALALAMVA
jgi:hypothetical protein